MKQDTKEMSMNELINEIDRLTPSYRAPRATGRASNADGNWPMKREPIFRSSPYGEPLNLDNVPPFPKREYHEQRATPGTGFALAFLLSIPFWIGVAWFAGAF